MPLPTTVHGGRVPGDRARGPVLRGDELERIMRGASPALLFLSYFAVFRDIFDEPALENTELLQDLFTGFVHMTLIATGALNAGGVEKRRYIKVYI